MNLPIIYFVAVVNNGIIYWQDDRLYKTEQGARKRKEELIDKHPKAVILYADEFKMC